MRQNNMNNDLFVQYYQLNDFHDGFNSYMIILILGTLLGNMTILA